MQINIIIRKPQIGFFFIKLASGLEIIIIVK